MSDRRVAAHEVLLYLQPRKGSVTTAELVADAVGANAPADVIATLEQLPNRRWKSVDDAAAAIGVGSTGTRPDRPAGGKSDA